MDPYYDNSIILLQFERLFKLLNFKEEYENHNIEVLVDNARIHTGKPFSINDFGRGIGTRCPVSSIEYIDELNNRRIHVGYLRSGFDYFLEGFSPFHFPNRTRRALSIPLLFFYTKHSPTAKIYKNCQKTLKNTSNFVKPVAIRPEILSNALIHFPNRTRRALSNRHHYSPIQCSYWL